MINTIFLLPIILGSLKINNIETTGIKDFNIYDGGGNTSEGYVIESNEYSTSKYYTPYSSTYLKNYDNKKWSCINVSTLNFFDSNNNLAYTTLSNDVHSTNYSSNYKTFTLTQEYSILFDLPIDNLTRGYVEVKRGEATSLSYTSSSMFSTTSSDNFTTTLATNLSTSSGINYSGFSAKVSREISSSIVSSYSNIETIENSESTTITYNIKNDTSNTLHYALMRRGIYKGYVTHYFGLVNGTSGVYKYIDSLYTFKFYTNSNYISCCSYTLNTNGKFILTTDCKKEGFAYLDAYNQ